MLDLLLVDLFYMYLFFFMVVVFVVCDCLPFAARRIASGAAVTCFTTSVSGLRACRRFGCRVAYLLRAVASAWPLLQASC